MRNPLFVLSLLLVLSALIISGCGSTAATATPSTGGAMETPSVAQPTLVPTAVPPQVSAEAAPTPISDLGDPLPEEADQPSEIVSLDETWNLYTNYRLGFSIKVPKTMVSFLGFCKWNEENGDHSYRPDPAFVPVRIFEDADSVYITAEYYYELAGETTDDSGGGHFFAECNKVTNSLELLQDPDKYHEMWHFASQDIHNDEELDAFIKSHYGVGCSLGDKSPSAQAGVYDVSILGDGKDLAETACPLNFWYIIKYAPSAHRVIAWNPGQAFTFAAELDYSAVNDQEMIDSFEFIVDASDLEDPGSFMPEGASEEIADWWGVINSTEPGAQFDDYFERQDLGQVIYFGIESMDPAVQAQIEALRDGGKVVHLYGTLLSNVPDYNGSQILVTRIEVDEIADLTGYTNDDFGFTFQYPADWVLEVVPRRPLDAGEVMLADAIVLRKDKLTISIQHIRMSEPAGWDGRLGGSGPVQEAEAYPMNLLGQEVRKLVWTDDEGIKAIMLQVVNQEADLVLQIELYDASAQWIGDPAAKTIPETAIGALDQILNSLALTP